MRRVHVCSTPGCWRLDPCPEHARPRNARWSRDRDGAAQNRLRAVVMRRADGVCERCRRAPATVAHHVRPGYQPTDALALCDACHAELDVNARSTA